MSRWFVVLGSTPSLSLQELEEVLTREQCGHLIGQITPEIAEIFFNHDDPQNVLNLLGGSVKIASLVTTATSLPEIITSVASQTNLFTQKAFALTFLPGDEAKEWALELKEKVIEKGHKFRFRLLNDIRESSGILSQYQELLFVKSSSSWLCLKTEAVQSLSTWTRKDYGRPVADPKSGMLPPKIARIMVNLSLSVHPNSKVVLYDPFCGTGTILTEALDLGLSVIGSDISAKAVADSTHNCHYLQETVQAPGTFRLFVSDIMAVTMKDLGSPVDAIVFEGYLGPPHLQPHQISNYYRGLKKLYIGVLKRCYHFLKKDGRLVIALPEYHQNGNVKNYHDLIDSCENYGYTQLGATLTYGRDQAVIKRSISVLQKAG